MNETAEAVNVSERFLYGDLCKMVLGEIKQLQMPWPTMTEASQQAVINRMNERMRAMVREVVNIIAGKDRPTVLADIDSVTFKDGIKVVLSVGKMTGNRHALADAEGGPVLLVLPGYEEVLEGEVPKADRDQPDLLEGEA